MEVVDNTNQTERKRINYNNMLGTQWNKYLLAEWMNDCEENVL